LPPLERAAAGDAVVVTAAGAQRLGTRLIEHYWHF
jgi:hypothetical protein